MGRAPLGVSGSTSCGHRWVRGGPGSWHPPPPALGVHPPRESRRSRRPHLGLLQQAPHGVLPLLLPPALDADDGDEQEDDHQQSPHHAGDDGCHLAAGQEVTGMGETVMELGGGDPGWRSAPPAPRGVGVRVAQGTRAHTLASGPRDSRPRPGSCTCGHSVQQPPHRQQPPPLPPHDPRPGRTSPWTHEWVQLVGQSWQTPSSSGYFQTGTKEASAFTPLGQRRTHCCASL